MLELNNLSCMLELEAAQHERTVNNNCFVDYHIPGNFGGH